MSKISDMQDFLKPARDEDGHPITQRQWDSLRQQLETERMRLAACGVVALSNTPESAAKARDMFPDYRSASCDDVARAVDREIELRQQLAGANARIAALGEVSLNQQKQVKLLRDTVMSVRDITQNALATTEPKEQEK